MDHQLLQRQRELDLKGLALTLIHSTGVLLSYDKRLYHIIEDVYQQNLQTVKQQCLEKMRTKTDKPRQPRRTTTSFLRQANGQKVGGRSLFSADAQLRDLYFDANQKKIINGESIVIRPSVNSTSELIPLI